MTKETVDKLVVDVELSAKNFNKQADATEQRYDDLSKNLDKTSKKIKLKSKKAKKDLSGITKETNEAGEAFKNSGKATQKFFSPLTKGTLAFAAAALTLKSIADGLANVAQRFADVNTLSKETGVGRDVLTARENTEEYFNIRKGTYANAAQMAAAEIGNWRTSMRISEPYQKALTLLGVKWNPNDVDAMLNQAIANAHSRYSNVQDRNQVLGQLGLFGYGTNNLGDVNKKFNENLNIEKGRLGLYEQSEKYRQEYVTAQQELSRAFDKLATALMPIATQLIKYVTPAIEAISDPKKAVDDAKRGWDSVQKDIKSETPSQKMQRLEALKAENPWLTKLLPSFSSSVNNQTNNITNNVSITTNDPGKVIQNLSAKGIESGRLSSNYMSSR